MHTGRSARVRQIIQANAWSLPALSLWGGYTNAGMNIARRRCETLFQCVKLSDLLQSHPFLTGCSTTTHYKTQVVYIRHCGGYIPLHQHLRWWYTYWWFMSTEAGDILYIPPPDSEQWCSSIVRVVVINHQPFSAITSLYPQAAS